MSRTDTTAGRLARRGFLDPRAAEAIIAEWPDELVQGTVDSLASAADPDLALVGLERLAEEDPGLRRRMVGEPHLAGQLVAVLGASQGMHQHMVRNPGMVDALAEPATRRDAAEHRRAMLAAVGADPEDAAPVASSTDGDGLREAYAGALVRIAARDLTAEDPLEVLPSISAELADLADAVLEAGVAIGRAVAGEDAGKVRLAVVALGKTGGQELNYVSDVDVLYVVEPVLGEDGSPAIGADALASVGTRIASTLQQVCGAHTGSGTIWPVDAALRPEGKAGPLVRTLDSHRTYYTKWAKNWEKQAMLKARAAAGDIELGQDFVDMVSPLVWAVGGQERFVRDVQAMRKRVVDHIPAKEKNREIKLSEGGLRDTEFTVQLIQLVHGRVDERVRTRGTIDGLEALVTYGYVGREDGAEMAAAYRLQRVLEHRIQLYRMRRSHLLPESEQDLRRLGRSIGYRNDPATTVTRAFRASTREVVALHRRIFYSPLLQAASAIGTEELRLTTEGAEDRLRGLGYVDPRSALKHIGALTQGTSRQAEIQRQILPAMLGWFADGPTPDAGLLAFRRVSEAMGRTSWYLRALRDEGAMAERLALILSTSRYATDMMLRAPQSVQMLADEADMEPRSAETLASQFTATAARHDDPAEAVGAIRAARRRELLRISVADILGRREVESIGLALSDVTAATIEAAWSVVVREAEQAGTPLPAIAIIAMGRWGGRELSYGSDADVMFVMEDDDDPAPKQRAAEAVGRLRDLLKLPGADPALPLDADLRPEGKGGPLVRTLESFRSYYQRWSSTWEAQALVRAAVGAGDRALGEQLVEVIDPVRWPKGGLDAKQLKEIRRLKARMEAERLPRGVERDRHVKLGPGGLSDVEWTVQVLQLQHAHDHPELRTTRTLEALRAARDLDYVEEGDAEVLAAAWQLASRIRDAVMLVRARPSDTLPGIGAEGDLVARVLGYDGNGELKAHYRELSHRARGVMDRVFWGE